MAAEAGLTSSPAPPKDFSSTQDEKDWYKEQYQVLLEGTQEYQEASKEIEAQLESDLEHSEARVRQFQEKYENAQFEVDEWRVRSSSCYSVMRIW
jgi:chromosome segregation ATPase